MFNIHYVFYAKEGCMITVLFLCVHNSARSQMAEAYCRLYGRGLIEAESAGLEPGALNGHVVRALREDGIDIAGKETRDAFSLLKEEKRYDYVVSVCSREAAERCPVFPGTSEKLHWPFADPSTFTGSDEQVMVRVREVRDAIKERVRQFVVEVRTR
jgi:arsenate reductase (thioredoxin)